MRPIQLHPLSVLVGLGIAALAFVAMGQTPQVLDPVVRRPGQPAAVIAARDMVQIKEGTPYVVPAGKLFVATGLGATDSGNCGANWRAELLVNGTKECSVRAEYNWSNVGEARSMLPLPTGLAISAGSQVDVSDTCPASQFGRAWGYLADA